MSPGALSGSDRFVITVSFAAPAGPGLDEAMSVLRVASCQFPVTAEIGANLAWVKRQTRAASERGADVAPFSEAALSGYAGTDLRSFAGWPTGQWLASCTAAP